MNYHDRKEARAAQSREEEWQELTDLLHRHEAHPDYLYLDMENVTINDPFRAWLAERGCEPNKSGRWRVRVADNITEMEQLREVAKRVDGKGKHRAYADAL